MCSEGRYILSPTTICTERQYVPSHTFFSRTTGSIAIQLGTNQGIQVCSNEGPRPFPRGDNYKIAKIQVLKIFFSRITGPISMKIGTKFPWLKGCDGTYCRFVHIVVGDNMYRPSLHILSSIGTYCRQRQYVPRRPFFPSCIMDDEMCSHASAHIVVGDIMYRDHVHILSPIYYLDK